MSSGLAANRLAVLGAPISHSKSPAIHLAAYSVLGLDWSYDAVEVTSAGLGSYLNSLDSRWRGVSLTMPLKQDVLPMLSSRDPLVDTVGAANTILFDGGEVRGFNTDVGGVIRSFSDAGVSSLSYVHVLGSGATAASALVAVAKLGADRVVVSARSPEKASSFVDLGHRNGVEVTVRQWGVTDRSLIIPDAVISTLPGASNDLVFAEAIRTSSVLFDVSYDPWPSDLARAWDSVGGTVISGIDLLINQAIGQIRLFVCGDAELELPDEARVVRAMRSAVE